MTKETVISCPAVCTNEYTVQPGLVIVEGNRIKKVDAGSPPRSRALRHLRLKKGLLRPGCVDLHVHGFGPYGWRHPHELSQTLAVQGTTSFLLTIPARDAKPELVGRVARRLGSEKGARILGISLEGPFLNPEMAGAQKVHGLTLPDIDLASSLVDASRGQLRMMTVAPELPGAPEVIKYLYECGVIVAAGHSAASWEEMFRLKKYVRHITHLFCRSGAWHHRQPGLTGWAVLDDTQSVELIPEPNHLHPAALEMVFRIKPLKKVVLVSDSVPWNMVRYPVLNGTAMWDRAGVLQGTTCSVAAGCRWAEQNTSITSRSLWTACTSNPASVLNLYDRGAIKPGAFADLVLWDQDRVLMTMVEGQVVYGPRSTA